MEKKINFCKECNHKGYKIENTAIPYARATFCPSCFSSCPLCSGAKFFKKTGSDGIEYIQNCECNELEKKIALFNNARIPNRFQTPFQGENFKKKSLQEPYKKAKEFVENFSPSRKGLIFSGAIGSGKTTLVCAIIQHLTLEKNIPARFFEFSRLLEEIRSRYDKHESEFLFLNEICQVPLLAIDEIGKGKNTEWEIGVIESIISRRYDAKQVTIFATNNSPKKTENNVPLSDRISHRAYSRIQEMCEWVEIKGKDLRQKINENNIVIEN